MKPYEIPFPRSYMRAASTSMLLAALSGCTGDVVRLGTAAESIDNFLHGYRTERVTTALKSAPCTVPFLFRPDTGPDRMSPVLLLHGITDSSDAFAPYIRRVRREGAARENLVAADWPQNGNSDCPQARSPEEAAEGLYSGFEALRLANRWPPPRVIVGASMGVVVSVFLAQKYPQAQLVWITPPIMDPPHTAALNQMIRDMEKPEVTRTFVDLARSDPKPLPSIAYRALSARGVRARRVLENYDLERVLAALSTIDPARVRVYVGNSDRLCPPTRLHPAFTARFGLDTQTLECGHDISRHCFRKLPLRF